MFPAGPSVRLQRAPTTVVLVLAQMEFLNPTALGVYLRAPARAKFFVGGETMHILWTCLIGLVVGAVAKFLMPGKDPGGIIITMLLGIAGAFVASFLGRTMGWYADGSGAGFLMSVLGAMLLLFVYRLTKKRGAAA